MTGTSFELLVVSPVVYNFALLNSAQALSVYNSDTSDGFLSERNRMNKKGIIAFVKIKGFLKGEALLSGYFHYRVDLIARYKPQSMAKIYQTVKFYFGFELIACSKLF